MLELRKMDYIDIRQQWEYVIALPEDEKGIVLKKSFVVRAMAQRD